MLTKNTIAYINLLSQKKNRDKECKFIAEGTKLVNDLLHSSYHVLSVFSISENIQSQIYQEQSSTSEFQIISENEMRRITQLKNPSNVLALVEIPNITFQIQDIKDQITIFLDDIQDPGNLGTIIRTADWFGIKNIICSKNTVDIYNPKVVQASMGSITRVKLFYTDIIEFFESVSLFNIPIYGTFLNGNDIYQHPLSPNGIIIMGNEGSGIRKDIEKFIKNKLHIPCFQKTELTPESLNVSVATAIICSEFRRRNFK